MELCEFAKHVLFATRLGDKLRAPEAITDNHPGSALESVEVPGRPSNLVFKPENSGPSGDFPSMRRLVNETDRGRLLHFFANHELLATELMALVLLRFPNAPAAFRRGVLRTLADEQVHTRLYLKRMAECGIQFGDLPVSGYFWRSVSSMAHPIDFVAGLSLTFEQANLDFCRQFAGVFKDFGDVQSAALLDRIYRDEIAHIAHGLKWFRRWKNPAESDWEAFCRQLKFPLSPQRAKGPALNIEGRLAAGLDNAFIAELNVFSQSRGRTPSVYWFNPFSEGRIDKGNGFCPVKSQAQLASDLAALPLFLCRQDDVVLIEKRPSIEFLSGCKSAGFPLPEFVETSRTAELARRKLGALRPWAWGPDSMELLEPLFPAVTGEKRLPEARFNQDIARLYSKSWSADFLRRILTEWTETRANGPGGNVSAGDGRNEWLCSEDIVGRTVDSLDQAVEVVADFRARRHHPLVAKEAIGLAGRNSIRLLEPKLLDSQKAWLRHATERGGKVVIEPWLHRLVDFSVQLEMQPDGLHLCGFTGLINDRKGQFQANWAAPSFRKRIPQSISQLFPNPAAARQLSEICDFIIKRLEVELRRADFLGPVGIDALVYRMSEGGVRLKPIVEINPRFTMGRATVELMERILPGGWGLFRIIGRSALRADSFEDFHTLAIAIQKQFPLQLSGQPVPKILSGAICLNDPCAAQACLAVLYVFREREDFEQQLRLLAGGDSKMES